MGPSSPLSENKRGQQQEAQEPCGVGSSWLDLQPEGSGVGRVSFQGPLPCLSPTPAPPLLMETVILSPLSWRQLYCPTWGPGESIREERKVLLVLTRSSQQEMGDQSTFSLSVFFF